MFSGDLVMDGPEKGEYTDDFLTNHIFLWNI